MATVQLTTDDMTGETLPQGTPTTRIYVEDPRGDVSVEIDLSDTSFKGLQKALDKILAKARPITPPTPKKVGDNATEAALARAWAIAERPDLDVKERGQVPKAVIVAYRAHLDNSEAEQSDSDTAAQE